MTPAVPVVHLLVLVGVTGPRAVACLPIAAHVPRPDPYPAALSVAEYANAPGGVLAAAAASATARLRLLLDDDSLAGLQGSEPRRPRRRAPPDPREYEQDCDPQSWHRE